MKQRELIKKLEAAGFELSRHGGNDDEYVRELQQERQNILDEYAKKLEELTNA